MSSAAPPGVDPRAASGFRNADVYERARPTYPDESVDAVFTALGLGAASEVLDLGAGTGKLTRSLVPRARHVIAVDASEAMLAKLAEAVPGAEARRGSAQKIPLPDTALDAVFVAQAFHWFGTAEVIGELARVLRPGGGLGLLWNEELWKESELPWLEQFRALTVPPRRAQGPPPADHDRWQSALDESALFEPLQSFTFKWVREQRGEQFVALVDSWSWIFNLPDPERSRVLDGVRELVGGDDALVRVRYATEAYWTRLAGGGGEGGHEGDR